MSNPWHVRACELAQWAFNRYIVRTDRYGGYYATLEGKKGTCNRPKEASPDCVNLALLERHFRASKRGHIVGAHTLNTNDVGRYCAVDVDAHPGKKADPEANERFALQIDATLRKLGLRPLTYESNGAGGFHVVQFFSDLVDGVNLFHFARRLVRNHAEYGFAKPPETFPKQSSIRGRYGNWLRIVGRHHTRDHWPRVWDGSTWLEEESAVDYVLALSGDDPRLINPFDRFNHDSTIESVGAMLQQHGWEFVGTRDNRHDYRRPGKDEGESGNIMLIEGVPVFYPFTDATTLEQNKALNPSQLRCRLEFGDDFGMLAKQLWCEILGDPPPAPKPSEDASNKPARREGMSKSSPSKKAVEPVEQEEGDNPDNTVAILRCYLRQRYRPDFKRGNTIHSESGEMVSMTVACEVPTSKLIEQLAGAIDAPLTNSAVNHDKLPSHFRKWAKVAWGDLLDSLPEEEEAALAPSSVAADEFQRLIRHAMLTEIVIGDIISRESVTRTERRSLIGWCKKFAKEGPWKDIRSKMCWCKTEVLPTGEIKLKVAIRHELFSQLRANRRLVDMSPNLFNRLARQYGIGTTPRDDRPHGRRALILSDELVDDLTNGFIGDEEIDDCQSTEI